MAAALTIARPLEGKVWLRLGHVLSGQRDGEAANSIYQQAWDIFQTLAQSGLACEALTGLAYTSWRQGQAAAGQYLETLLL